MILFSFVSTFLMVVNVLDTPIEGTKPIISLGEVRVRSNAFLKVVFPNGQEAFTRQSFLVGDLEGRVVTQDHFPIEPQVTVDQAQTYFMVSDKGIVLSLDKNYKVVAEGKIIAFSFQNPQDLEPLGSGFFKVTGTSGAPMEIAEPGRFLAVRD